MKYLICGFSGAGKTTLLGKIKNDSQYKNYSFFDLDHEILKEKKINSVSSYIETFGWDEFRKAEQNILQLLLSNYQYCWIALGGGTLNDANIIQFKQDQSIKVFFLDTPLEVCISRLNSDGDRPLLKEGEDFLRELYKTRLPMYKNFERILDT